MVAYESAKDRDDIHNEMPWEQRDMPQTLYALLKGTTDRHASRPAMSFQITSGPNDRAETLTWQDFHDQTCQVANLFRGLGIGEGEVVAYVLPNCTEAAITLIGGSIAGIANPINPLLDAEQIAAILRETNAKVVVTLRAFPRTDVAQKVAEAVAMAPGVGTVLEVDLLRYLSPPKSWIVPLIRPKNPVGHSARVLNFRAEMQKQNKVLDFPDSDGDRVAAYFHTGGTTGMPKVAQHKYSGLVYNGWIGNRLLFQHDDVIICPLPLFHVFACHVILKAMITSGAHGVFPTPQGYRGEGVFDNFWKLIERWKVTFVIAVPTAIAALMQRPVDADVSSLKTAFSGSAPLPNELIHRFEAATGVQVVEGYGLTEATCLVACNPISDQRKVGSVGLPFPHTDVRILNCAEDGSVLNECAVDEIGEICVSNPGVWAGHTYTDAGKNAGLYADGGYLRTGDLGRLDQDGYLFITGRAKDLIIRGGHNIDPSQIEEALAAHPDVAFVGAIGQPDSYAGETPCAYVELVADAQVTAEELREFASKHVHEKAARPKYVEILDELPKTAVGKVFKPDLRKRAIARIYDEALQEAGVAARVAQVTEDKKLGLLAEICTTGECATEDVAAALKSFTRPWKMQED